MKTIKVVAAVIREGNKVFATQRGYGDLIGGWEFPGGKVEPNESYEEALIREIKEELDVDIEVQDYLDTIEYDYPTFHLSMECYFCKVLNNEEFILKEHQAAKWLTKDTLYSVDWLPADIALISKIEEKL